MSGLLVFGVVIASSVAVTLGLALTLRQWAYRRQFNYRPIESCVARFTGSNVGRISVRCSRDGFVIPDLKPDVVGGLLELDVRATVTGSLCDPAVEIEAQKYRDVQFLERGVRGIRFINVSRLVAARIAAGEKVKLRGRHIAWCDDTIRLHVCCERLNDNDRVLVVAPHPDDAEIAAFGLYADTNSTIVTITSGDGSDRFRDDNGVNVCLSRAAVARMRVWDSITVPQFGGVGPERAVNLCYPDGKLQLMHAEPNGAFCSDGDDGPDFAGLRRLNRSPLILDGAVCTWESLVRDLRHILSTVQPTVIVAPHPWLDPHLDHAFTTAAVCEAMQAEGLIEGRLFFYTNHNRCSELWPFGPAGSGVALLPMLAEHILECDGFYSHVLSSERQGEKFLALEAMHDLRDVGTPQAGLARPPWRRTRPEIAAALNGLRRPLASYMRRAVRPDEFFFTTSFANGRELSKRTLNRVAAGVS
jgi:LmbE family N-acetylglucosaminyl deacetylase